MAEHKDAMQLIAGIIAMIAYIPLIVGIARNKAEQSFAAFLLWALLDSIATITTYLEHGNYWLPFSNVIGTITVTLLLVVKRQVSWSWVENVTAFLVIICVAIWYSAGEQAGIVASSLAVVIASIPQMVDTFKRPRTTPVLSYILFFSANVVSFLAGRTWTIEERFYAACSMFLCFVIIFFAFSRRTTHR
ncbi:hypothetical protein DQQ10_13200 [Pseudochryseolinea flava]|uniref:PQ-loop repeat-containing protein n=2 Tax=Pseudochryseolinea flava TaxID=2059302 RepID=A0A364Y1P0_9BACT|nr:hypothetical protein DQQ10_13200 [Pseudochryseolinea flava]